MFDAGFAEAFNGQWGACVEVSPINNYTPWCVDGMLVGVRPPQHRVNNPFSRHDSLERNSTLDMDLVCPSYSGLPDRTIPRLLLPRKNTKGVGAASFR